MKPIIVVGSSNTDLVAQVERLPGEGETIMARGFERFAGGKGANQGVAAAKAGTAVAFAGAVGSDAFGRDTEATLAACGLDLKYLERMNGAASGTAMISVDTNGRNQIVVVPGANGLIGPAQIDAIDFSSFSIAVFQLEIPHETVWYALHRAREAGCTTILNPAPAAAIPDAVFGNIDYLIPNEHELEILAGCAGPLEENADAVRKRGVANLIVTLGADGAVWLSDEQCAAVPAPDAPVVDTVGAGDCVVGVFAACLGKGCSVEDSLKYAMAAATISVGRVGAQASYASWDEIKAFAQEVFAGDVAVH
ncbi:MAG: ribokinase [Pontiellaceae bacterium]|nr:ribokinase [Pontiellaceae bacterium]MBN2783475.1 ribokinase [Pontiellaceae bacterium]